MINKNKNLIYFLTAIIFVLSALVFFSPAPSFADHCTYPETHHSDGTCYCTDDISDCSDPCGDGRLASCDTCNNGASNPPGCDSCPPGQEMYEGNCVDECPEYQHRDSTGECVADSCPPPQEGVPPFCYDPVCTPPKQGTYPDCGTCTVSGTNGYPTCNCSSTGKPPTGNPPACVNITYCCSDRKALNFDSSCPDTTNNKEEDNGTCEYCSSSSTDPRCRVSYCPDSDPGGDACKQANPDMNCTSDESMCRYYYCDKSTGRPDNYDPGGRDCKQEHPDPRQCIGDESYCTYAPVPYCDKEANPDATNGQTKADCESWNDPHPCVADDNVCSSGCTGGNCVEISYCSLPGFSNSDFGGVKCNSTKPADAICVAAPLTCTGCTVCTPKEYCNDPAFLNYDPGGASCKASFPVCTGSKSACTGLASCDVDFDVDVACESGFTYTGTFNYSYTYDNTEQCVAPTGTALSDIKNYLEGIICDDVVVIDGFDDVDWCPLMDGIQTDPLDCLDVCPDMEGLQHNQTDCPTVDTDLCKNIAGIQNVLPPGSTRNASGECDVCSNIEGFQVTVPTGSSRDAFSNTCDLCTNQEGFQSTLRLCEERNVDGTCSRKSNCTCDSSDPNCYDYQTDGLCGSAKGKTYEPGETVGGSILVLGIPTTYSTCYSGTYSNLTLSGTNYTWKCNGIGTGSSNASCSALLGCRISGETICPYTGACMTTEECEDICVTNPALCDPCLVNPAQCVHDCKTDESKCLGAVELDQLKTTPPLGSAGFECSVDLNGAFLKYDKNTNCKLTGNAFANYDPTQSCSITDINGVLFTFKPIDLPLSYFFIVDDVCTDSVYTLTCWQSSKPDETVSVEGSCRVNYRYKEIR